VHGEFICSAHRPAIAGAMAPSALPDALFARLAQSVPQPCKNVLLIFRLSVRQIYFGETACAEPGDSLSDQYPSRSNRLRIALRYRRTASAFSRTRRSDGFS
jgi:hypothetical protein